MPLLVGCSRTVIKRNRRKLIKEGYPPKQAHAIAMSRAREYRRMCKHLGHLKKPKKRRRRRDGTFLGIF